MQKNNEITVKGSSINIYSWEANTMTAAADSAITVGRMNSDATCKRVYINLNIPQLPNNPHIKKAELVMPVQTTYNNEEMMPLLPKVALYHVTENITVGECTPAYNERLIDYVTVPFDNPVIFECKFDLLKILDEYFDSFSSDTSSYTLPTNLVLKLMDENKDAGITFCGNNGTMYAPVLNLTYEQSLGYDSSRHYHTNEFGRFGSSMVDLQTGHLIFEAEEFAWGGNRMPVTIKHIYNSSIWNKNYTYSNIDTNKISTANFGAMDLGLGWKLNIMQSMIYDSDNDCYIYADESGNEHIFSAFTKNENGTEYTLYQDAEDSETVYDPSTRTLTMSDNKYLFDNDDRLVSITDKFGNSMTINYVDGRITAVTDGAGRSFVFEYENNNAASKRLTSITAPDGSKISYEYDGGFYTKKFTFPDGNILEYYLSGGCTHQVTLFDKENYEPSYSCIYETSNDCVTKINEYWSSDYVTEKNIITSLKYSAASNRAFLQTVTEIDASDSEAEGTTVNTVYCFDKDGNVTHEYSYTDDDYVDDGSSEHPNLSGESGNNTIKNLAKNHNFNSLDNWEAMSNNEGDTLSIITDESNAKYGSNALKITSSSSTNQVGVYQALGTLSTGEYTLSAYVKLNTAYTGDTNNGAYIAILNALDDTILGISDRINDISIGFIRLTTSVNITEEMPVKICLLTDGIGEAYFDAVQFEKSSFASAYNMVLNGGFEQGEEGWELYSCDIKDITTKNNELFAEGIIDLGRGAVHTVTNIKKAKGTKETFVLSGWAKFDGVSAHERYGNDDASCNITAMIYYTDGTNENYTAEFPPFVDDWQFASVEFSKSKYLEVEKIDISCNYSANYGEAYFDDIQLIRTSLEENLSQTDIEEVESTEALETAESENADFEEVIDTFGNALTETTFADGEFGTIYRSFVFNEASENLENAGNDLVSETDARGNKTFYEVDELTSRNKSVTDRLRNKTRYEYDVSGNVSKVISRDSEDNELSNVSYSYDIFNNLNEIVRGDGLKYVLSYTAYNELEAIKISGKSESLINYTYKSGNGKLKQITYANGDKMAATYNGNGQMIAEKWFNKNNSLTAHYKYRYDYEGNIVSSIDILSLKEYNYIYESGRLMRSTENSITIDENEFIVSKQLICSQLYYYDSEDKLTKKVIKFANGGERVVNYETKDDNTVLKLLVDGKTVTSHSKTDSFGRKVFDELQLGSGFVSRQFSYLTGEFTEEHQDNAKLKSSPTTQLVSQITFDDGRTIEYEYDAEERITKVTDSLDGVTEYTYDALGQLTTETVNGTVTNTMTYDNYGNIIQKNGIQYLYDNVWKDKLIQVGTSDNSEITYDAQGNPINYLGHTLTWQKGRQLTSFDTNTYTYNANGIRTSKTVGSIRHTYILDGAKILRETWGSNTLETLYDNEDNVCGIIYNKDAYYFLKNLQGDIIAIANADGDTVARYTYDAWGKCTIHYTSVNSSIADINPYRYRGYYYDKEIGMYYLQSRYYDPEVARFVNSDEAVFATISQGALGHNLFAYCENCVITKTDQNGFASTTYGGITCSKTSKGFSVKMHAKFLQKTFCKNYAKHVISTWGKRNKHSGMNATRIAAEIFGHAVLFVLGIVIGAYSIWNLVYAYKAKKYLSKIAQIISLASFRVATYLIDRSKVIDVNSNESWYRVAAFWVIWGFFPPVVW